MIVGLEYKYSNNGRILTGTNDTQNPDIVVYTNVNIDKSEYLRATIDYNKSYKFWEGTFSVALEKPFMEIPYLGEMKEINKISYYFLINNDFKVSKKTTFFCNFSYSSPSEDLMSYYYKSYNLSAGLNTSFLDDKFKLSLYVNDILNSSETTWKDQFGNVESYSDQDRDNTFFSISLKYNFNKYKGGIRKKTAGNEELNRM